MSKQPETPELKGQISSYHVEKKIDLSSDSQIGRFSTRNVSMVSWISGSMVDLGEIVDKELQAETIQMVLAQSG